MIEMGRWIQPVTAKLTAEILACSLHLQHPDRRVQNLGVLLSSRDGSVTQDNYSLCRRWDRLINP
jgi:hypothetical protein